MDAEQIRELVLTEIEQDQVVALVQRLVRVPSYQTALLEADPNLQRFIRETVKREVDNLALPSQTDPMGNLIIRIGPREAKKRIIIFGYAMTHPAGRMQNPTDGSIVDGSAHGYPGPCIRGRGAAEQKGAMGAFLAAAALVNRYESDLVGELIVCVSSAGETGRHDAAIQMMRTLGEPSADMAIVAIGSNNSICLANKGRIDALITVRGRAAHSSTPWLGLNAIEGARHVLNRLAALELAGEHPALGRPTLTVTSIKSYPDATHTVQDEVRIVVDRRLLPGQEKDAALEELRRTLADMDPYELTVELGPVNLPAEVRPDSAVVKALEEAMEAAGLPVRHHYSHGCVDAGFFCSRGIPAVMFGPGDQRLWHTDTELVSVAALLAAARTYAYVALRHLTQ